jgi:hypothetical protein
MSKIFWGALAILMSLFMLFMNKTYLPKLLIHPKIAEILSALITQIKQFKAAGVQNIVQYKSMQIMYLIQNI